MVILVVILGGGAPVGGHPVYSAELPNSTPYLVLGAQ